MKRTVAVLLAIMGASVAAPTETEAAPPAQWTLRVDNYGNPDAPGFWASGNFIFIRQVMRKDGVGTACDGGCPIPNPEVVSGKHDYTWGPYEFSSQIRDLKNIQICTDGDDLFVIDQIEIFDEYGALYRTFGIDNMNGWCLSTDHSESWGACTTPTETCHTFWL